VLVTAAATGIWLAWNATWIAGGSAPPSILKWATGLPVPTTGFTRSLRAWADGRWTEALAWNPFAPVFVGLLAASAIVLAQAALRRRPLLLPRPLAGAWLGTLAAAWILKAAQGPRWW
jgi:hypothetical protein